MSLDLAVMAAWLHDIGKFAQRAGAKASVGMDQEYCPGGSSHRHVVYTDYFIEHVLPLPYGMESERSRLARMASAHHRADSDSRIELAIQKADRLSSGLDRIRGEAGGDYKSARLESIFCRVRLGDTGLPENSEPERYALLPLNAGRAIFPGARTTDAGDGYSALYRQFCEALGNIPLNLGMRAYMGSLVSILEHYTWCIPSSTWKTRADISLFDHASTTAAITQALLTCPAEKEEFLLFGGDLSGIQAYIFGDGVSADKGASKLLRARSFLLQAVTRSVWLVALERLGLTPAAKIMDAGGRFVLLLPRTPEVENVLDTLEDDAESWLLRFYQGEVRLNFGRLPLAVDDVSQERFGGCFEAFNDALEQAKLRPFSRSFMKGKDSVFDVDHAAYRANGECEYCRSRPATRAQDGDAAACSKCADLVRLGSRLPRTRYIVFSHQTGKTCNALFEGRHILFNDLSLSLHEEEPAARDISGALEVLSIRGDLRFSVSPIAGHVPLISSADIARWQKEGRLAGNGGESLLNGESCERGEPKTFSMLAEEARIPPAAPGKPWRSIPCLAVCKADVDNLGLIFGLGLGAGGRNDFSISRFAMLARMLNFFFSSWLMRVVEEEYPDIYVIFAGGDDLFVLGPWHRTIDFAVRMRRDFVAFCGGNPAVTISAGLPLVRPGLPMRAVREEAERSLERSKNHSRNKNAATLFGVTATWPEFEKLLENGHWLEKLCLNDEISRGLVRRMLGYARDCRAFCEGDIRKGLYLSHLDYDIARNCSDKDGETANRLRAMGQDKNSFPMEELGISWAIYRTRTA